MSTANAAPRAATQDPRNPNVELSLPRNERKFSKPIAYACSGCSDVGELADRISRRLSQSGAVEMSCLAGIGGRVKNLMSKGQTAERILVIDGCALNCARRTLELAGISNFDHLGLNQLGLLKGKCPVTEETIAIGLQAANTLIGRSGI
jgi:uncharacterized metal-binding protein